VLLLLLLLLRLLPLRPPLQAKVEILERRERERKSARERLGMSKREKAIDIDKKIEMGE
jgi:hypothetical protein